MKKLFSVVLGSCLLCSCSVPQKTEVSKFTVDMNVVKTNRPDLYERYMKGEIVIDDVYLDQTPFLITEWIIMRCNLYQPMPVNE